MRRRRKRFSKFKPANEEMALQITSMADIFTIILVFLLKSFSTGMSNVTPSSHVILPESKMTDEVSETLKIEISKEAVLLDDKPVTSLAEFKFAATDLEGDGTPRSLNAALIYERQRKPSSVAGFEEAGETQVEQSKLLVMADQAAPYATVKTVMDAAANNGYTDFKLVVVQDQ